MAENNPNQDSSHHSDQEPSNNHVLAGASMISGSVIGMSLLGYFLDKKFGWEPWGLLIGALLGVVVGMYELWKLMFSGKSS